MSFTSPLASLVDLSTAFTTPASEGLSDSSLLQMQRDLAEIRRRVDAWSASVAAQIAHRSRHELGGEGLARRLGARTPEVRVGALISEPSVPGASVADAAESLLADAPTLTVEKLATRAREVTAGLDEQHVVDRARAMRTARYLRLAPQSGGMTRPSGLLDPESAAIIVATFDAVTSPRRGGPRFVDPAAVDYSERITRDERTTEQITVDAFVELVRIGAAAAPDIVGAQRPAVRVLVTDFYLTRGAGFGHIEAQRSPISIATIERQLCDRGTVALDVDTTGQVINVGRSRRLFTARQRIGLAVRDGGCRFPGSERPPSWYEAHHIIPWSHGGRTDLADGASPEYVPSSATPPAELLLGVNQLHRRFTVRVGGVGGNKLDCRDQRDERRIESRDRGKVALAATNGFADQNIYTLAVGALLSSAGRYFATPDRNASD